MSHESPFTVVEAPASAAEAMQMVAELEVLLRGRHHGSALVALLSAYVQIAKGCPECAARAPQHLGGAGLLITHLVDGAVPTSAHVH